MGTNGEHLSPRVKRRRQVDAAFQHQDGDGFNVILQALPIPNGDGQCKIVLRPPKSEDAEPQPQEPTNRNNKSGSRRR
jgi:hypothetical protein